MRIKTSVGFTLIELVLVIAILVCLAITTLPNIFDISLNTSRQNSRDAVVSAVQSGLSLYAATQLSQDNSESYPATLDSASNTVASRDNPFFVSIVRGGIHRDWSKKGDACYTWTSGGAVDDYEYDSSNGTFLYDSDGC